MIYLLIKSKYTYKKSEVYCIKSKEVEKYMGRTIDSSGTMVKDLKSMICAFYDCDKQCMRDEQSKVFLNTTFTESRENLIRDFVNFLMTSDFFNDYTKYYLSHFSHTYRMVADDFDSKFNTVKASVWFYISKLEKRISRDELRHLIAGNDKNKLLTVRRKIEAIIGNIESAQSLVKNLTLSIPKTVKNNAVLSEDDFDRFVAIIYPYTKKVKEKAVENITEDMAGYFYYLIEYAEHLDGEDKKRLEHLRNLLSDKN